jgi:hypothetical protein
MRKMYMVIAERIKEGFKTVKRGNSEDLDPEPMAEIWAERLLQQEKLLNGILTDYKTVRREAK